MLKGFICFGEGKIPFVVENYRMELYTDDALLKEFAKEYNFKHNYILEGQCFSNKFQGQKTIFLVEQSMGGTCYLRCYIIFMLAVQDEYDIRPLAKLDKAVKVADASNQRKAKCKTVSAIAVALREDTKSFDKVDSVFNKDTIL